LLLVSSLLLASLCVTRKVYRQKLFKGWKLIFFDFLKIHFFFKQFSTLLSHSLNHHHVSYFRGFSIPPHSFMSDVSAFLRFFQHLSLASFTAWFDALADALRMCVYVSELMGKKWKSRGQQSPNDDHIWVKLFVI
jgi:hypothetical protein